MARDLPQPLIFTAWIDRFVDLVLQGAGIPLANAGPRSEFAAYVLSPVLSPQGAGTLPPEGAGVGARWCGGDCAVTLRASLEAAVTDLAARFGPDPTAWRWGAAHQAVFAHPLLRQLPVLGRLTTFRIASPGGDTTIDRGVPTQGSFESMHGPAFRGVYDLADLDQSRFVIAPGQSGNPLSSHAGDFLRRWRDGGMVMLGSSMPKSGTLGPNAVTITASIRLLP
jgi:penicillin amidase